MTISLLTKTPNIAAFVILVLISGCSQKLPLDSISKKASGFEKASCPSLELALEHYQALNTILVKRKRRQIHLHWNKTLIPLIIAEKEEDDDDDLFRETVWSGFEQVKALTGLNYVKNNYYGFEPNYYIFHVDRKKLARFKEYPPTLSSCLPDSGSHERTILLKANQNHECRRYSGFADKKIYDWFEVVGAMASNQDAIGGKIKKFTNEDLCGVYLVSHKKNNSIIDKAVMTIPKELPPDQKIRCFSAMLLRSMGLITGYYASPVHDYQDLSQRWGVVGLDAAIYDNRLQSIGCSVLNQQISFRDFTEQDKFFLQYHYYDSQAREADYMKSFDESEWSLLPK